MQPDVIHLSTIIGAAQERRTRSLEGRAIDAYRLLRGVADGAPDDLAVDRYLNYVVVSHRDTLAADTAEAWCAALKAAVSPAGIVLKRMAKTPRESESRVVFGAVPREPIRVREEDAVFLCDLDAGPQTGLFLDHQETRFEIRRFAAGVEVLNLFAYTAAFSVHAALAGASRVTSVDVSKRALDRGRANMLESGLDPDRHRWFADDVLEHLGRKRGSTASSYGLIILDPPVFGRSKKRTFSLLRDLEPMIEGALALLAPDGVLVFSTHATQLSMEELTRRIPARVLSSREEPPLKTLFLQK